MTRKTSNRPSRMKETQMADRATIKNGYWYYFTSGDDEIAVHCSALSGKERVYFNDELLIEKTGLGFNAQHFFQRDGHRYEVLLVSQKLSRGAMECILFKDDQVIGRDTKAYLVEGDRKGWMRSLGPFFLAGMVAGMAGAIIGLTFGG